MKLITSNVPPDAPPVKHAIPQAPGAIASAFEGTAGIVHGIGPSSLFAISGPLCAGRRLPAGAVVTRVADPLRSPRFRRVLASSGLDHVAARSVGGQTIETDGR